VRRSSGSRRRGLVATGAVVGTAALLAACGGGDDAAGDGNGPVASVTTAGGPVASVTTAGAAATQPTGSDTTGAGPTGTLEHAAGDQPSELSRMVCEEPEVRQSVEYYTATELVADPVPTWVDRLYTCPYVLADGTLTLSVKELDDAAGTERYFGELRTSLGDVGRIYLGDDAFQTRAGSVVVRKDNLVMLVDSTTLPDHPSPRTRSQVATNVATIIMACWVGE
jgi:hypothetical protein